MVTKISWTEISLSFFIPKNKRSHFTIRLLLRNGGVSMIELELKYKVEKFPRLSEGFHKVKSVSIEDLYYDNDTYDLLHRGIFIRKRGIRIDIKYLVSSKDNCVCNEVNIAPDKFTVKNKELCEVLRKLGLVFTSNNFESFLKENNLSLLLSISKKREKYIKEDITICFDTVKDLGEFVEIESVFDELDDISSAKLRMKELIEKEIKFIGYFYEETTGYVELYLKKYNRIAYERCLFKG